MARYKLTLAYDGSRFFGSQRQSRRRTVQAEIERAAHRLGWKGESVVLAGRTDAGVHALGQVAALDLAWSHPTEALREAFNANLPEDLAVVRVEVANEAFHPRFDAQSRSYRYALRCAAVRHPLDDRAAWRVWPAVRLSDLQQAASMFLGTWDFAAFGTATRSGGLTLRTVLRSGWSAGDGVLKYHVEADGFLYRMVRRLVFVQVAVCHGRCSRAVVERSLETGRKEAGLPVGTAPAKGLRLVRVRYQTAA